MLLQDVVVLHPVESVTFDAGALQSLALAAGSGNLTSETDDLFEDFVVCLSSVESAWSAGEFERLQVRAEALVELSERLGLQQSASVARHLVGLVGRRDDVALAAVVSRSVRVAEASLASALEYAYRRI